MNVNKEIVLFGGWGLIVLIGFAAMKLYPEQLNPSAAFTLWIVLTLIGIGLMVFTMDLRDRTNRAIAGVWAGVFVIGYAVTYMVHNNSGWFPLFPYMGAVWLGLISLGHLGTGAVSGNPTFLRLGVVQLVVAALMALLKDTALLGDWQFVITGLVAAAAMFSLVVPRPAVLRRL